MRVTSKYGGHGTNHSCLEDFRRINYINRIKCSQYYEVIGTCCHCGDVKTKEFCRACLLK